MEGTWRVEHQMLEVCVQCDVKDLWIKNEDFWCRLLCLCVVFWIWKAWSRHRAATSHQSGHLRRIRQPTTRSASVNTRNPAPPPSPLRITSHMCNRRWKSVNIDEKGKNSTKNAYSGKPYFANSAFFNIVQTAFAPPPTFWTSMLQIFLDDF